MKAVVYSQYGPPENMQLVDVPVPTPGDGEVLVQVHAVALNGSDWETLTGKPLYARLGGLRRPARPILGSDIAGRVAQVGPNVRQFQVGEAVFGDNLEKMGGFAEYALAAEKVLAPKPPEMSFAVAATLPQAGVIALRGICDTGRVQPGQRVLINGAGGGAGMLAVQLAKAAGAEVTAVDNAGKLDWLRTLGADHGLDYARQDFTRTGRQYDLILDLVASRGLVALPRALLPGGTYYFVGGSTALIFQLLLFGPVIHRLTGKRLRVLLAQSRPGDLVRLTELVAAGRLNPVIDRQYPLSEVPAALRRQGEGRALGKVVINLEEV